MKTIRMAKQETWIFHLGVTLLGLLALSATSCGDPTLRSVERADRFTQGALPKHMDLVFVLDQSSSAAKVRRAVRDQLVDVIDSLNSPDSLLRVGVFASAAVSNQNRAASFGVAGYGLDGSFTTSSDNSVAITQGSNTNTDFQDAIDKISLLTSTRSESGGAFDKYRHTSEYTSYFNGIAGFSGGPSQITLINPQQTYNRVGDGFFTMGLFENNFFTALQMAKTRRADFFGPAANGVNTQAIPLGVVLLSDGTNTIDPTYTKNTAKTLIKNLRRIPNGNGGTKANVVLVSMVDASSGGGALTDGSTLTQITNELEADAADGVEGLVHAYNDAQAPNLGNLITQFQQTLSEPKAQFCLSATPRAGTTPVVSVNAQTQVQETDYTFTDNCVNFKPGSVPTTGEEILIQYST